MSKKILVTGGAGFIGSALVRHLIAATPWTMINADKRETSSSFCGVPKVKQRFSPALVGSKISTYCRFSKDSIISGGIEFIK
ncbi:MAG: NAD-dependent epimerase/dehydratase family protein [Desulfobacterales bacterium]|nr:NAD-dependent epimerase/dehydratase family protein [Desulfobacterales bacterium]